MPFVLLLVVIIGKGDVAHAELVQTCTGHTMRLNCTASTIQIQRALVADSSCYGSTNCCPQSYDCTDSTSQSHLQTLVNSCNGRPSCQVQPESKRFWCGGLYMYNDYERVEFRCIVPTTTTTATTTTSQSSSSSSLTSTTSYSTSSSSSSSVSSFSDLASSDSSSAIAVISSPSLPPERSITIDVDAATTTDDNDTETAAATADDASNPSSNNVIFNAETSSDESASALSAKRDHSSTILLAVVIPVIIVAITAAVLVICYIRRHRDNGKTNSFENPEYSSVTFGSLQNSNRTSTAEQPAFELETSTGAAVGNGRSFELGSYPYSDVVDAKAADAEPRTRSGTCCPDYFIPICDTPPAAVADRKTAQIYVNVDPKAPGCPLYSQPRSYATEPSTGASENEYVEQSSLFREPTPSSSSTAVQPSDYYCDMARRPSKDDGL